MDKEYNALIIDLLPRYCDGTVSEEERIQVENWICQSEENYRTAKQIYTIYLATDTIDIMGQLDSHKALAEVKSRMSKKNKNNWLEWTQRVAAVLLIPVLFMWMLQYIRKDDNAILMMETKTSPGMITSLMLPDSTVVYLNSGSSLTYPSAFTGDVREISLQGEAYFRVKKDEKKQFIVSTSPDTKILVYGTEFNVEAYPSELEITATLVKGSIGFIYNPENIWKKVTMEPGQKARYNLEGKVLSLEEVNVECETAWKDGRLVFRDTPFADVLKSLGRRYNVEFIVINPRIYNEAFTGTFERQRLNRILEYLKMSSNIKYKYITDDNGNINEEREKIEIY